MKLTQEITGGIKVADQKGRITLGSRYAGRHFAVREEADGATVLTPVLLVPEKVQLLTSRRLTESFEALQTLQDNWDGRGSLTPTVALVASAREVTALLHVGALANGLRWEEPHIGSNEQGQVSLEWWHGTRSLTVFIRSAELVEYLKAWGSDIESEMEAGEVSRLADFAALSGWLYAGDTQAL